MGAKNRGICSSLNNILIQNNSAVVTAKDRYSASVLDRDTTGVFLALQDTKHLPKKTTKLEVDRRSLGSQPNPSHKKLVIEVDPWSKRGHGQDYSSDSA
jgi:hypothetical protein